MNNKITYEVARELFFEEISEENLFDCDYVEFVSWLADHGLEVKDGE